MSRPTGPQPSPRLLMAGALAVLAVSWALGASGPPGSRELDLTRWFAGAPDVVAVLLWPVMQLGTLWAPLVAAVVLSVPFGRARGLVVAVSGAGAWLAAKLVKEAVERGRPLEYLPDIDVRDGEGTGLGFVSGHTAVAFALATALAPLLAPRWRVVAYVVAAAVGVARLVFGVHLPLDVLGGAALGIGLAATVELVHWGIGLGGETVSRRPG